MVKEKDTAYRRKIVCIRIASALLALMLAVMFASPQFAFADDEKEQEKPLREVHRVGIKEGVYCFFVQHNVVLTPKEIEEKTDEELTSLILEKAGLYIKEANCRLETHKAIPITDWKKKNGTIFLTEKELMSLREAEPVDGAPVKLYMDLMITNESEDTGEKTEEAVFEETPETGEEEENEDTEDEKPAPYSTYKRISPELIFVAVATEADAASVEEICEDEAKPVVPEKKEKTKKQKIKNPPIEKPEPSEEEMLPEYRTISMADRSGGPIEETLKDGDPVYLEWIEPKHSGIEGETSFTDRIPGGTTGLVVMAAAAAAACGAIIFAAKKKREDE